MINIIAFILSMFAFMFIAQSPLSNYLPEPTRTIISIINEMEAYEEDIPYSLSVVRTAKSTDYEDLEPMKIDEIIKAIEGLSNLTKITETEYSYKIDDEIFTLNLYFEEEMEEEVFYIDFYITDSQIDYLNDVYLTAKNISVKLENTQVIDYQLSEKVTEDNLEMVKENLKAFFSL